MICATQNFIRHYVLTSAPQFPRKWQPATRKDVLAFVATERDVARRDIESFADKNKKAKNLRATFESTGVLYFLDLWLDEFASVANHAMATIALGGDPFKSKTQK